MQKEEKTTNKTLITILTIIGVILILSLITGYLLYTYYSDNEGGGGSAVVNETNKTQPPVDETPTVTTNQTPTNTTSTSTTMTTGGGSNNGGGGGTTTPTCTDTCNSLGYECGNWSICGSEVNCGGCGDSEVCNNGKCSAEGEPYCGDTICTGTENCTNCPEDCGCESGKECKEGVCELVDCRTENNCYYVSVNGDYENTGTIESPWNMEKAQRYAEQNNNTKITYKLLEGNYGDVYFPTPAGGPPWQMQPREENKWVVWEATSENTVFESLKMGAAENTEGYMKFIGIKVQRETHTDEYVKTNRVGSIEFYNMTLIGVGYSGTTPRGFYLSGPGNYKIIGCNITGEYSESYSGGFSYAIDGANSKNVLIKNNDISNSYTGVLVQGENFIIENNHIHQIDDDGIVVEKSKNTLIQNNTIHDLMPPIFFNQKVPSYYSKADNTIYAKSGTPFPGINGEVFARFTLSNSSYITRYVHQWHRINALESDSTSLKILDGWNFTEDYNEITNIELLAGWNHNDFIQFNYVNVSNVTLRNNLMYNSFRQALFLNPSSYQGDCVVEGNLIYNCNMQGGLAYDVTIGGNIKDNIYFNNNTLDGKLTTGVVNITSVKNNIIKGLYIKTREGAIVEQEDHNLFGYAHSYTMPYYTPGEKTIMIGNEYQNIFLDYDNSDYRPLINSPACNGSINPVGVAVGALPCVCTQDSQCVEVYGTGSTCNPVTKECEWGLGTQPPKTPIISKIIELFKNLFS